MSIAHFVRLLLPVSGAALISVGCKGPLDMKALPGQEAELAAEGQYDERQQDGTLGNEATDSLTADQYRGLGGEPFLPSRAAGDLGSRAGLDENASPPDSAAILVPGPESATGGIPSSPGSQEPLE